MNENFDYFLKNFAPLSDQNFPAMETIEKYRGKLPEQLLLCWQKWGWAGLNDGLFWISDPDAYRGAVDLWLKKIKSRKNEKYHAIARSAFGKIFLWGEQTGQTLTINPLCCQVVITAEDEDMRTEPDLIVSIFFGTQTADYLDFEDNKEKPLFQRALKKLGRLASDEMYGFEPALCMGGLPKIENLVKLKIIEHLMLLAQLDDIHIVNFAESDNF